MTTPVPTVEGFSLKHAQILDGTETFQQALARTDTENWRLYGVNEASLDPDTDSYNNEGDDRIQSIWNWFNYAELEVQGGFLPFKAISTITGAPMTSSGTGTPTQYYIDLWTEKSMNIAPKPMIVTMPSKDRLGAPRLLVVGLYKVSFGPIGFDGPSYKEGLKINYTAQALLSDYDETGTQFTDLADQGARAARLLSIAA
jgi:hypothetical protein